MIGAADIRMARERIAGRVRRTPIVRAAPLGRGTPLATALHLKLESLQVTGSFKARGAASKLASLPPEVVRRGVVTASGGNHGLGLAYAASLAGAPVSVYLPEGTPPARVGALEAYGARVVLEGAVWDDANRAALAAAGREGLTYVHPFADPAVVAGQGTVGLEILEDLPSADVLVAAVGGGGLVSGIGIAAAAHHRPVRVIGVEPVGAPTLHESLRAGRAVLLPEIRTAAHSLAPRASDPLNLEIVRRCVDAIVLVTDDEMREAARWLWDEMGVAVELGGAAATAALLAGKVRPGAGRHVCAVVCGAGTDGLPAARGGDAGPHRGA